MLHFVDRRTQPAPIEIIHAEPPQQASPLHTLNHGLMERGTEELWLGKHGITRAYIYKQAGVSLLSYFECDQQQVGA